MRYISTQKVDDLGASIKAGIALFNEKFGAHNYDFILSKCDTGTLDIIVFSANHMSNTTVFHSKINQSSACVEIVGEMVDGSTLEREKEGKRLFDHIESIATYLSFYFIFLFLPYIVVYAICRLLGFNNWIVPLVVPAIILVILSPDLIKTTNLKRKGSKKS